MTDLRFVLALALTVGVLAGVLEAVLVEALTRTGTSPIGVRHVVWMAPIADAFLLVSFSLATYALGRWIPVLRRPEVIVATAWTLVGLVLLLSVPGIHLLAIGVLSLGVGSLVYRSAVRAPR